MTLFSRNRGLKFGPHCLRHESDAAISPIRAGNNADQISNHDFSKISQKIKNPARPATVSSSIETPWQVRYAQLGVKYSLHVDKRCVVGLLIQNHHKASKVSQNQDKAGPSTFFTLLTFFYVRSSWTPPSDVRTPPFSHLQVRYLQLKL